MITLPALRPTVSALAHEQVTVVRGHRSGLSIIVAVHSTVIGPALGGCRLWNYPSWREAFDDALRLAEGMTAKNALAGLDNGGGKTVIQLPMGVVLDAERRRDAFLDVGDAVDAFGGRYRTAEDVGVNAHDMATVRERTEHVVGLPEDQGGLGDPGEHTADGVYSSLLATLKRTTGSTSTAGRLISIAGLGQVGSHLASRLARDGAVLTVTDLNPARQEFAASIGANWAEVDTIHRVESDVFMPAGVGGMLTRQVIDELRTRAIVGPANNQLAEQDGADQLAARGILYAPDYLVNAGGVIYLSTPSRTPEDFATTAGRIAAIGDTLERVFTMAETNGTSTLVAADTMVAERLGL